MTTHPSDAAPSRRAARDADEQAAGVVAMLQDLAPRLEVEPDPAFRLATRQRMVAMAAVRTPEPVRPSPLRRLLAARASDAPAARWRTRVTAGLAGAALTVTSLATLVALSTGARPGDVLYGVKRGTEQTQLALAGDSRGQVLLDLARTRLDELAGIAADAGLAESTLETMDRQTGEGAAWLTSRALDSSDTAPLDRLSGWAAEQSARLDEARTGVPAPAADEVDASRALLTQVTERADSLRAALACPAGPALLGTDLLGPVADGCLTAEPGIEPPVQVQPAPVPGVPTAPQLTSPAVPTGQQPAPGTVPSQVPGTPPVPVPDPGATPTTPPGGLLPGPLAPLPSTVPSPDSPAATPTTSSPVVGVPVPGLPLGVCVGPLLQLGRC